MAEMEKPGACGGGRASGQRASGRPAQAPDSCDQPERQTIVIVVAPVGRGKFSASYLGRVLVVSSNIPFCDAARALAGEGVDPATRIVMRHEGQSYDALISTVGAAAKLTVKESTRDGKPRFGDWHPYGGPGAPVAPPMSETGPAVISPPTPTPSPLLKPSSPGAR